LRLSSAKLDMDVWMLGCGLCDPRHDRIITQAEVGVNTLLP
jgi:hypothetical protein